MPGEIIKFSRPIDLSARGGEPVGRMQPMDEVTAARVRRRMERVLGPERPQLVTSKPVLVFDPSMGSV